MKLFVIRLSSIGDVVLALPVIKAILDENSDLEMTFLTRPPVDQMFENIPRLKVLAPDFKNEHKGLLGLYRLFKKLKKEEQFNYIIDLHGVLRTFILSFFFTLFSFKKVYRIKKGRKEKRDFIKKKIKHRLKHTTERYIDVFRRVGLTAQSLQIPSIDFHVNVKEEIDNIFLLRNNRLNHKKMIGIAPFAKHPTKIWGMEKIYELIEIINKKHDYHIFLFGGGKNEITQLDKITNKFNNVVNVAGEISLLEELYLISKMRFMITMDSANLHFSSIVGAKVVSIWGGTHPFVGFAPLGNNEEYIIQTPKENLDCRPCSVFGNKDCYIDEKYKCLKQISSQQVYDFIIDKKLMNKSAYDKKK